MLNPWIFTLDMRVIIVYTYLHSSSLEEWFLYTRKELTSGSQF